MNKNYLLIAIAAGALTSCTQEPDWFFDCDRNFSEDYATHAECVSSRDTYDTPGGGIVELRDDISGPRGDYDDSPDTGGNSGGGGGGGGGE